MKTTLLLLAGVSFGLASFFLARGRRNRSAPANQPPTEELAHQLQDAWADHHTVA
jgi:hypothetical protein